MTGRNEVASTLGTNVTLLVEVYRREFNYPSWFENTLGYAESGQISALALQQAANHLLNQGQMTVKPMYQSKMDSKRVREIIEEYHGDDIALLHGHASSFGTSMQEAKKERTSLQGKIDKLNLDSDLFHTMHLDQESRITRNAENIGKKADIGHKHSDSGGCPWYDIQCHVSQGFEGLGKLALIGGVAIVGIWLLKMRLAK